MIKFLSALAIVTGLLLTMSDGQMFTVINFIGLAVLCAGGRVMVKQDGLK